MRLVEVAPRLPGGFSESINLRPVARFAIRHRISSGPSRVDMHEFFRLLTGQRRQPLVVCHVDATIKAALGANSGAVWFSEDSASKQMIRHNDLEPEHYNMLPDIIGEGIALSESNYAYVIVDARPTAGRWLKVTLKRALRGGGEIWLTSFHKLRESDRKKLITRVPIIRAK
jgi:hypothetical protein